MNSHPKYNEIADICKRYPRKARAIFQAYLDIKYGQHNQSAKASTLLEIDVPAIICKDKVADDIPTTYQLFIPVNADENISVSQLSDLVQYSPKYAFPYKTTGIHLAIVENDSTVVYYKIDTFTTDLHTESVPKDLLPEADSVVL